MQKYSEDYLLDRRVRIFQPLDGYRASIDAVFLASVIKQIKKGDTILDVGSGTGAISLCLAERFKENGPRITGLELQPELTELSNISAAANGTARHLARFHTLSPIRPIPNTTCLRPIPAKLLLTTAKASASPAG